MTGEAHLVGDDQHRHAVRRESAHDDQHLAPELGVERRGRFVEQHHLRRHGERAGDGDALLLAAGQARRHDVALLGEADLVEKLLGHGHRRIAAHAAHAQRRLDDVLQHRHVRPQIEVLKDHADVRPHRTGGLANRGVGYGCADRHAVHDHPAFRGHLQQRQAAQQRRLARTAGTDDADDFALGHRQGHAVQDLVVAETLRHGFRRDDRPAV